MKLRIQIASSAERQFRKLQPILQDRIAAKILSLVAHPRPHGSQKLRNTQFYRIRIGDYRIIYSINDTHRIIKILDIAHRREVYR